MMKFGIYAHAVALKDEKILATFHDINAFGEFYGLPAIFVQEGQTTREALELAILALTGLYSSVGRLLLAKEFIPDALATQHGFPPWIALAFECQIASSQSPSLQDMDHFSDGSITGVGWLEVKDFRHDLPRSSWRGTFYQQAVCAALDELPFDFYETIGK